MTTNSIVTALAYGLHDKSGLAAIANIENSCLVDVLGYGIGFGQVIGINNILSKIDFCTI